mmetsp:Transcript_32551/g.127684  ORF Transcript_32551/g.127684 Transcript_32551/m.127684 type:complete len:85 (-) Transcript_32551:863-1117(-)
MDFVTAWTKATSRYPLVMCCSQKHFFFTFALRRMKGEEPVYLSFELSATVAVGLLLGTTSFALDDGTGEFLSKNNKRSMVGPWK